MSEPACERCRQTDHPEFRVCVVIAVIFALAVFGLVTLVEDAFNLLVAR